VMDHYPWLVAVAGDEVEGYASARPFRNRPAYAWTVETTVYVRADRRGLGIGRALTTSLIGCLRLQRYRTLLAVVALPNPASVRLHQELGYRSVGVFQNVGWKFGRWHDTAWYELDLGDDEPQPVLAPGEVDAAALSDAIRSGQELLRS